MASPLSLSTAESLKETKATAIKPRSGVKQGSVKSVHKHWQVRAREDSGFVYIPQSVWTDGLCKNAKACFYVSSFSKCVIVPPGYSYPHLTISLSDTLTLDKHVPHHVAIRSDSLHLSDSADAVRQVFYKRGLHNFVTRASVSSEALTKAQRWIENAGLPYRLRSLVPAPAVCSPVSDIMPVISKPSLTNAEITVDITDGSESDGESQETEPPISEETLAENKPARSVASPKAAKQSGRPRGKGGKGGKRGKRGKSRKGRGITSKSPKASPVDAPVAVSQPEEQKHYIQEWERRLGTDNLHEFLDNLPVGNLTTVDECECVDVFEQISDEFNHYTADVKNQTPMVYLMRTGYVFKRRFTKLKTEGKIKEERNRAALKIAFNNFRSHTSLYVSMEDRPVNRIEVALQYVDPDTFPLFWQYFGQASTKDAALVALKFGTVLLRYLKTDLFKMGMGAYGTAVFESLATVMPNGKYFSMLRGMSYLMDSGISMKCQDNAKASLAAAYDVGTLATLYALCSDSSTINEEQNYYENHEIDFLTLAFRLTELLCETDPGQLTDKIIPILKSVPAELEQQLIQLSRLKEEAQRELFLNQGTVSSQTTFKELAGVCDNFTFDFKGYNTKENAAQVMAIIERIDEAVAESVIPSASQLS